MTKSSAQSLRDEEFYRLFKDDFLLTVDQAALFLGVSNSTLNHWRSNGDGPPFIKLGPGKTGPIRYEVGKLKAWVDSCTYNSVAESLMGKALKRCSDIWTDFSTPHPYLVRSSFFVIDSCMADRETFLSVFMDPFARIAWLTAEQALGKLWLREERRLQLLGLYVNSTANQLALQQIENERTKSIRSVPLRHFAAHNNLTLQTLAETAGCNFPVEFGPISRKNT